MSIPSYSKSKGRRNQTQRYRDRGGSNTKYWYYQFSKTHPTKHFKKGLEAIYSYSEEDDDDNFEIFYNEYDLQLIAVSDSLGLNKNRKYKGKLLDNGWYEIEDLSGQFPPACFEVDET